MSCCPIAGLNPFKKSWNICGKVVAKSEIKRWSNANGAGHFFNFVIADNTSCIKAVAFNTECERFFSMVKLNNNYSISNGIVKETKKQYMELNNVYEIHLTNKAQIKLENEIKIQELDEPFIKISKLLNTPTDELINIKCIVNRIDDLQEYGSEKINYKRTLGLIDDSECEIELTLWNEKAQQFDCQTGTVIVAKRLKVSNYAGKNLLAIDVSNIIVNPDIPEVKILEDWFSKRNNGIAKYCLTLAPEKLDLRTIKKIKKSTNVNCDATVIQIATCNFYESCPDGCNKKLVEDDNGFLDCNSCNKTMMEGNHKLILKVKIADCSSHIYLTIYNEIIEKLLNNKADHLLRLEMENSDAFNVELNTKLLLKAFSFDIKIRMITRDGVLQPDYSANRIRPRSKSTDELIHEINNLIIELEKQ